MGCRSNGGPQYLPYDGSAHAAMLTDLQTLAKALGGEVNHRQVLAARPQRERSQLERETRQQCTGWLSGA